MNSNDGKLNMDVIENVMSKFGIDICFYFDKIRFYVDSRTNKKMLDELMLDNEKNNYKFVQLPHHEHLDKRVNLFQPSADILFDLAFGGIELGDYAINNVEIAIDFLPTSKVRKNKLQQFFDRHLVYNAGSKSQSSSQSKFYFYLHKEMRYYTHQSEKQRFVVYSDKASRTDSSKHCTHVEMRIERLKQVKALEVYTFRNLIDFDFRSYWEKNLDLRKPNYTELGKKTNYRLKQTGRVADSRRGQKVWSGIENLQSFLSSKPHCNRAFLPITTEKELHKWLSGVLDGA